MEKQAGCVALAEGLGFLPSGSGRSIFFFIWEKTVNGLAAALGERLRGESVAEAKSWRFFAFAPQDPLRTAVLKAMPHAGCFCGSPARPGGRLVGRLWALDTAGF